MKTNSMMMNRMDQQPHPVQKHFQAQQQQQQQGSPIKPSNNLSPENMNEFQLDQQNYDKINQDNNYSSNKFTSPNKPVQPFTENSSSQRQQILNKQQQQQLQQQQFKKEQPIQSQGAQSFENISEEEMDGEEHLPEEMSQEEHQLYLQAQMDQLQNHPVESNPNISGNNSNVGSSAPQNSNSNNSFSSADEIVTEDTTVKEDFEEVDKIAQKQLVSDPDKYFEKIIELNDVATLKLNDGHQKEALSILYKAEKMLEFAASCGKVIDRNLIIVVLYNRACAYQSLWILDKCSKYIDGVIYNLEMSLKEEDSQEESQAVMSDSARGTMNSQKSIKRSKQIDRELLAYKIKKQTFLVKSYLQCCAILSQQGFHVKAYETANEGANVLKRIFKQCYEFCRDTIKENESNINSNTMLKSPRQTFSNGLAQNASSSTLNGGEQTNPGNSTKSSQNSSQQQQQDPTTAGLSQKNQHYHLNQHGGPNHTQQGGQATTDYSIDSIMSSRKSMQQTKEEVQFQKLVVEYAFSILQDIQGLISNEGSEKSQLQHFKDAKKSLYFWKNNPENNEKHIRQELNVPTKLNEEETRSILGVQNGSEWIEGFNIGSIMHMVPVQYEEFSFFGDVMYEISKKMILEKVIYLSISYFTIATEIRFIEIDKNKNQNQKGDGSKNLDTEGFKQSQIYHLKSIQIVCKHITCKSPYINHLITSYHKHYNQNLETIQEESFCSIPENTTLLENSNLQQISQMKQQQQPQKPTLTQTYPTTSSQPPSAILTAEDQGLEELVDNFVNYTDTSGDDQVVIYNNHPNLPHNLSVSVTKFQPPQKLSQQNQAPRVSSSSSKTHDTNKIKSKKNHQKTNGISNTGMNTNHHAVTQGSQSSREGQSNQSTRSQYSLSKEKKSAQLSSRKKLNLDFSGSFSGQAPNQPSNPQTTTITTTQPASGIQTVNQNLASNLQKSPEFQQLRNEFLSLENSKKNTPRGVFSLRKSTPAAQNSNNIRENLKTEPCSSPSLNHVRSPSSKSSKKRSSKNSKDTNTHISQKLSKMSVNCMSQMLREGFQMQYATPISFLQQQQLNNHFGQSNNSKSQMSLINSNFRVNSEGDNEKRDDIKEIIRLNHSNNLNNQVEYLVNNNVKQRDQLLQDKLKQPENISSDMPFQKYQQLRVTDNSTNPNIQGIQTVQKTKQDILQEQNELRSTAVGNLVKQISNGIKKRPNTAVNSKDINIPTNIAANVSGSQGGVLKKSDSTKVTLLTNSSACETDRKKREQWPIQIQNTQGSQSKHSGELVPQKKQLKQSQQNGQQSLRVSQNCKTESDEGNTELFTKNNYVVQQTNSNNNIVLQNNQQSQKEHYNGNNRISQSPLNYLSIKNLKKETIQELLRESKIIPKLNLNLATLKLQLSDKKYFSPREQSQQQQGKNVFQKNVANLL